MSWVRHRQMSRLEKLAAPTIDYVRRKDDAYKQWLKDCASLHAISLALLSFTAIQIWMNHCRMLGKDVVDDSQVCGTWID